jgi:hypothetical protein
MGNVISMVPRLDKWVKCHEIYGKLIVEINERNMTLRYRSLTPQFDLSIVESSALTLAIASHLKRLLEATRQDDDVQD